MVNKDQTTIPTTPLLLIAHVLVVFRGGWIDDTAAQVNAGTQHLNFPFHEDLSLPRNLQSNRPDLYETVSNMQRAVAASNVSTQPPDM
jgi:hypothetical protein